MSNNDIKTIRYLVEEDIGALRIRRGCYPLREINKASNLLRLLGCKSKSDEEKKIRLIQVVNECFADDAHKAGKLLAAFNLLDGYEAITAPEPRLLKYQDEHDPAGVHVKGSMLYKQTVGYAKEFLDWLIEKAESNELDETLRRMQSKSAATQTPQREYKHNLPRRNSGYIDRKNRESLLNDIRRYYDIGAKVPNEQLIHGMGGVGKTQLATEYVHRFLKDYPVVCWLAADHAFADAVAFVKYMEPEEYERLQNIEDNSSALVAAFRQWFEHNTGWLLIIDDVDDKKQVEAFLPQGAGGHTLITSRTALTWVGASTFIEVFDEDTAVAFLMGRTWSRNKDGARSLAIRLGCFPLALEQAAAYINAWPDIDFAKYLSLLDKYGLSVFDDADTERDYSHTVNTVWEISMEKVYEANMAAKDFLCLCAYFAPDDIDFFVFVDKARRLKERSLDESMQTFDADGNLTIKDEFPASLIPELSDDLRQRKLISELTKYSLVRYNHEKITVSIHRLLQEIIRVNMADKNLAYLVSCLYMLRYESLGVRDFEKYVSEYLDTTIKKEYFGKSIVILPDGFREYLPHFCSIYGHLEPLIYKGHVRFKDTWKTYRLISQAYRAFENHSMERYYLHKALVFAHGEGYDSEDVRYLLQDILLMALDEERAKNDRYMIDYNCYRISFLIESGTLKVQIDFMKEQEGEAHPCPLIIEMPYPFENAPA
jgi:hypothetical protein